MHRKLLCPLLAACCLAGCTSRPTSESRIQRVAFLPVENLTGDSSLDWISQALPAIAVSQLTGSATVTPFNAHTVVEAVTGDAIRFVHGTFDRRAGKLHFDFSIEDSQTHKMIRTLALDTAVLETAGQLAKSFDPAAHEFSSTNPEAVEAWGRQDFARAVELDPDFGGAWLAWVQWLMNHTQPEPALETAKRALARPSLRSPLDQANLRVLEATLRGDDTARDRALVEVVKLLPNDIQLARNLAEGAYNGRRFEQAVEFYQLAIRLAPSDKTVYNSLGYALALKGDLAAARRAFDEYAQAPGERANALDSQGEALFLHSQFTDAERYFLEAHQADPERQKGDDLRKAAYSRWLAGDLREADRIFERYIKYMSEQKDSSVEWRSAVWLYTTGRQMEALALLERQQEGPAAALAKQQLDWWQHPERLPTDVNVLAQAYQRTPPAQDGLGQVLYARALVQAGKRDEARKLLMLYPLPGLSDPLLQAFVYPMYLDLKKQVQ